MDRHELTDINYKYKFMEKLCQVAAYSFSVLERGCIKSADMLAGILTEKG